MLHGRLELLKLSVANGGGIDVDDRRRHSSSFPWTGLNQLQHPGRPCWQHIVTVAIESGRARDYRRPIPPLGRQAGVLGGGHGALAPDEEQASGGAIGSKRRSWFCGRRGSHASSHATERGWSARSSKS